MIHRITMIICFICSILLAVDDPYPQTTSTDSTFYTKSSACITEIHSHSGSLEATIYGHPLGSLDIQFWLNDSIVIVSSGCCEQIIFFEYDAKNKTAFRYEHKVLDDLSLNKKIQDLLENNQIPVAYLELEENSNKVQVDSTYLIWEESWKKVLTEEQN